MDTKHLLYHAQFHGAKRLLEQRHRLYWGVSLMLLLMCAVGNLYNTVARFLDAPINYVTTDNFSTSLQFPAVLVCPEVYYPDYKIEHLLEQAKYPDNMTADTIRPIIRQLTAFFSPDPAFDVGELSLIQEFLEYNDLDVEKAGQMLSPTCNETLLRCRFRWDDYKCSEIFRMELTVYGFCCVFNGKSLKSELNGRRIRRMKKRREWHTNYVGPFASLMLAINQSQSLDNVDLSYKWMVLQNRQWYVDMATNGTPLSPGVEVWTSFLTRYLHISDDSLFMSENLRGCWMEDRKLKYFPTYNKKNCLLECEMHRVIGLCHCLLPVYYRPLGVPLCDAASLPCVRKALDEFDKKICNCKYVCEHQKEQTESNSYELSSMSRTVDRFYEGLDLNRVTIVRIYIKSYETFSYVRRPYFNFIDLYSQVGGVFNVFFGCSILSIFELLQLAWYSFRDTSRTREIKRAAPVTKSIKKKNLMLFGVHRPTRGRVEKVSQAKKVTFSKKKILKDLPWLQ